MVGNHGADHVLRGAAVRPDLSHVNVVATTHGLSKLTRRKARMAERVRGFFLLNSRVSGRLAHILKPRNLWCPLTYMA